MTKEAGPREKALREMREAKIADASHKRYLLSKLKTDVAVASQKRGKSRKGTKSS